MLTRRIHADQFFREAGLGLFVSTGRVPLPGEEPIPVDLTEVPHSHDAWEIVFIQQGEGVHVTEHREYDVRRGDVFVVPSDTRHHFHNRVEMVHTNIMFAPDQLSLPWAELAELRGYQTLFVVEPALRSRGTVVGHFRLDADHLARVDERIRSIAGLQQGRPVGYRALVLRAFLDLIVELCDACVAHQEQWPLTHHRFAELLAALEHNYKHRWTIDEMCDVAALSRRALQYRFRSSLAATPVEHLNRVRIQRARSLLAMGASVTEAAHGVGFENASYFSRLFRRETGCTPSRYR